jgi:hypothetical protein
MSGEMGGGSFTVTTGLKRTHGTRTPMTNLLSSPLYYSPPDLCPTYLSDLPFRLTLGLSLPSSDDSSRPTGTVSLFLLVLLQPLLHGRLMCSLFT